MKTTLLIISTFILLTSCSVKNDCTNRFDLISTLDSIPLLNIDITKHPDTIRQEIVRLCNFDVCKLCTWVEVKIPFIFENQDAFLKVIVDFEPFCENCPPSIRLRHYFSILLNQNNQILVEGKLVELDSLYLLISSYLSTIGNDEMAPDNFKQVNYRIIWNQNTDKCYLDSVLTIICKAHLDIIERQVRLEGKEFCKIDKNEILKLKEQFPLRIEFDLGKYWKLLPPSFEKDIIRK